MLSKTTEAYIEFLKIRQDSYGDKIRFYEKHISIIQSLPEKENIELRLHYLLALFQVGAYKKYLDCVDPMVEFVIKENMFLFEGEDIYFQLLLNKASAHYNLFEIDQAFDVSRQLHKINATNPVNKLLLRRLFAKKFASSTRNIKALGIGLYFFSGFLIALQILLVEPFYYQYNAHAQLAWQSMFVLGSTILLINELRIKYLSAKQAELI